MRPKPKGGILYRSYEPRDLQAIVELDAACFDPPFRFSHQSMRLFVEAENAWVTVLPKARAKAEPKRVIYSRMPVPSETSVDKPPNTSCILAPCNSGSCS